MRKERTGFILLQLQLVLFLLLLLPCVVLAHFQSLVRSGSLLLSDLRLYRAARYSLSLVKANYPTRACRSSCMAIRNGTVLR